MAQTLVEDRAYHLTGDEHVKGKRVYSVKLTDSCLKAIEEYIIHKVCSQIIFSLVIHSCYFY